MQDSQETRVQSLGGKIPRRRKWHSTPIFLPGKFQGQRSVVGYNPWGHRELAMTEHTHRYLVFPAQPISSSQRNPVSSKRGCPVPCDLPSDPCWLIRGYSQELGNGPRDTGPAGSEERSLRVMGPKSWHGYLDIHRCHRGRPKKLGWSRMYAGAGGGTTSSRPLGLRETARLECSGPRSPENLFYEHPHPTPWPSNTPPSTC